jgi:hypothetical protein
MKSFFCIFAFILALGDFRPAFASTPEYLEIQEQPAARSEFTFSAGMALQTGYLTTQDSVGTYIFGANFVTPGGLLSVEFQGFNADHDTGEFPLENNKSVIVSTFAFIPNVRVYTKEALNIYLGLGLIQVGLFQTAPENRVSYGSFVFSGLLRYELSDKWSLLYKTQWYNVNKTENDQKTSFEVWNHALGAGYSFF